MIVGIVWLAIGLMYLAVCYVGSGEPKEPGHDPFLSG